MPNLRAAMTALIMASGDSLGVREARRRTLNWVLVEETKVGLTEEMLGVNAGSAAGIL